MPPLHQRHELRRLLKRFTGKHDGDTNTAGGQGQSDQVEWWKNNPQAKHIDKVYKCLGNEFLRSISETKIVARHLDTFVDQQSGHVGRLFGLEVLVDAILASRNVLGRSIEIACRFYDLAEQVTQHYSILKIL